MSRKYLNGNIMNAQLSLVEAFYLRYGSKIAISWTD